MKFYSRCYTIDIRSEASQSSAIDPKIYKESGGGFADPDKAQDRKKTGPLFNESNS